jgi:hypothetical protein
MNSAAALIWMTSHQNLDWHALKVRANVPKNGERNEKDYGF